MVAGRRYVRMEREDDPGALVTVRAGGLWWTLSVEGTVWTNEGDENVVADLGRELELLDPTPLLASAILRVVGDGEVAGRGVVVMEARPRPGDGVPLWWAFTDPFEVAIDAQRGMALRRPGMEVTDVAFDEAFPKELFAAPDRGEALRMQGPPRPPRETTLQEMRRAAPFMMLLPSARPEGARLTECLLDSPDPPGWLSLTWTIDPGGRYFLRITERPDHAADAGSPDERIVTRDGARLRVQEWGGQGWRRVNVVTERHGTLAELHSDLPAETVIGVAISLKTDG